jgi:hypothetical protein
VGRKMKEMRFKQYGLWTLNPYPITSYSLSTSKEPSCEEHSSKEPSCEEYSSKEPSCEEYPSKEPSCEEHPSKEPSCEKYPSKEPSCEEYPSKELLSGEIFSSISSADSSFERNSSREPFPKEPSSKEYSKEPSSTEPSYKEPSSGESSSEKPSSREPCSFDSLSLWRMHFSGLVKEISIPGLNIVLPIHDSVFTVGSAMLHISTEGDHYICNFYILIISITRMILYVL